MLLVLLSFFFVWITPVSAAEATPCNICNATYTCQTVASYPYCDHALDECSSTYPCKKPAPTATPKPPPTATPVPPPSCASFNGYCGQGGDSCCTGLSCTGTSQVCKWNNGHTCTQGSDCATGYCAPNGTCSLAPTPTITITPTPICAAYDEYCGQGGKTCCSNLSCVSASYLCKWNNGLDCTTDMECATGRCIKAMGAPTGTCAQVQPDGGTCAQASDCISKYCESGVCKSCASLSQSCLNVPCCKDESDRDIMVCDAGGVCKISYYFGCTQDSECRSGTYCNIDPYCISHPNECHGICMIPRAVGEYCNDLNRCESILSCLDNICAPRPTPISSCSNPGESCSAYDNKCCLGSYCDITQHQCVASTCIPGTSQCMGSEPHVTLKTCNRLGNAYTYTSCPEGYLCNNQKNACVPSHSFNFYETCAKNSNCSSNYCGKADVVDTGLVCLPQYTCSENKERALAINWGGGIYWDQTVYCKEGCDPGINSCVNGKLQFCNTAEEGQYTFDRMEKCINGEWQCVEGSLKRLTSSSLQRELSTYMRCVEGQWQLDHKYTQLMNNKYFCSNNEIWEMIDINQDRLYKSCPTDTFCLDKNVNLPTDCYSTEQTKNVLGCLPGEILFSINDQTQNCGNTSKQFTIDSVLPTSILSYNQYLALHNQTTCTNTFFRNNKIFEGNISWIDGKTRDCRLRCSSDGQVVDDYCRSPLRPSPWERVCGDDGNVYAIGDSLTDHELIDRCQNGCTQGECRTSAGLACSKEGNVMPVGNDHYLVCKNGKYEPYAHNAKISWMGCPNDYIFTTLENATDIADYLIHPFTLPPIQCGLEDTVYSGMVQHNRIKPVDFWLTCGDASTEWCQEVFAHELTHALATSTFVGIGNYDADNPNFNEVVGCESNNTDRSYIFDNEDPVSDYGHTNCAEAYAESASAYANTHTGLSACDMKRNFPCQYQFFRDDKSSPFYNLGEHKEFCDDPTIPLNCPSNTSSQLFSAYAQSVTPAPSADLFNTLRSLLVSTELPAAIKAQALSGISTDDGIYYEFPSLSSSHPHVVRTSTRGVITYISLTLPPENQADYQGRLLSKGGPEILLGNSRTEYIYAYPSAGIAFLVNEYGGNVYGVWEFHPMGIEAFKTTISKNYAEIPTKETAKIPDMDADNDVDFLDLFPDLPNLNSLQQFNLGISSFGFTR